MINRLDLTVGRNQGAVVEIVSTQIPPITATRPSGPGQEVQEGLPGGINEIRFQEQVLGRVPVTAISGKATRSTSCLRASSNCSSIFRRFPGDLPRWC